MFICFNLACTLVYKNHCGNNFGNSFNERSLQYKSVMKIKHQILIGYLLSHLPMKNCQMLFILKHFDQSIFKLFSDLLSRILFAIYIFLSSVFLSLFLAILLWKTDQTHALFQPTCLIFCMSLANWQRNRNKKVELKGFQSKK